MARRRTVRGVKSGNMRAMLKAFVSILAVATALGPFQLYWGSSRDSRTKPVGTAGAGSPRAEHTWIVLTPSELDPRLSRELEQMAARDQALIRVVHRSGEARRYRLRPGNLFLELREEKKAQSFFDALKREARNARLEPTDVLAREGYILEAFYPRASVPDRIRITATSPAGFHHALLRVPELLTVWPSNLDSSLNPPVQAVRVDKNRTQAVLSDFPSFPVRGIVEGFYGRPWSHQDRLEVLRFEGQQAMNVYYYAPKDDPYHRTLWQEPYPPQEMSRLSELAETARRNFVDFCFAISPGLSMRYSSDEDFSVLVRKLDSVARLGVSCIALFLDDVPPELQDPQDQSRFKTLAQAHAYVVNKLYEHLKSRWPDARLTFTPTTYTNEWGSRDYIKELV